ncbi:MAG: homocysteine S-methyltransferase family protein [Lachnospiraceae bacterium]|nr:homocysteine S-methyltransferase family protein [Lachnospiraceae bacterium]
MKILDYMRDNFIFLDGGMGTLLQEAGLKPGELPERWNVTHPEEIIRIQKAYFDAGSNVVLANTFGANCLKFDDEELEKLINAAFANAVKAKEESNGKQEKFIALDIGPLGRLLKPYGDFEFEDAVAAYAKTVKIGAKAGADLVFIETMNDSYDTKAALLAVKENCDLPVFVSNAYGSDGKLMTGASPASMVAMLEGMHADAIGANCSLGPEQLIGVMEEYLEYASVPVLIKPNAGLPRDEGGKTVYDVYPPEFSDCIKLLLEKGVRIVGGCCGTTPDYIKAVVDKASKVTPVPVTDKNKSLVSSYTHAVEFGHSPILIGERINPTGKKRFQQALRDNDIDYILNEGLKQADAGVQVLDVNVGLPEINEPEMLESVAKELQAVTDLPLQLDTSDPVAMERGLRCYNGKAMVNSVNGKDEVMDAVFPLVAKYGGFVVCLTLDEGGIPETAEKRVEIAERIVKKAASYGIAKKDLIFDPLAMTISADTTAALATIQAVHDIRHGLGANTSLGVSNVSFGLPSRNIITSTFFALTLEQGLSAAIMNPYAMEMMNVYYAFRALHNMDANCTDYITYAQSLPAMAPAGANAGAGANNANTSGSNAKGSQMTSGGAGDASSGNVSALQNAIIRGLKEQAGNITKELLKEVKPLDIVQQEVIPALDIVGKNFEEKKVYLPQLLMAAEASKEAFEEIKKEMAKSADGAGPKRCSFVIATVHGDIHDIGKNIVKLILENYGFDVHDLGKDVPEQVVVDKVVELHAPIVGLSALMTTTVPAMEETIRLLREQAPWAKVTVGGAVMTQEYSDRIGADKYCRDAMETVRYAEEVEKSLKG